MSDMDFFYSQRVRRALRLRDGGVDFSHFVDELTDNKREQHGLETSSRRLEILG